MTTSSLCPPVDRLWAFLNGELPEPEKTDLTRHVSTCPTCRNALESLRGGATMSLAVPLPQDVGGETTAPAPVVSSPEHDLWFLAPATRPGHLGRIGAYSVVRILGRGGMGMVFEAIDPALERVVALKVMAPHLATSAAARQRFLREARSAASVRHGHVVTIHTVDEMEGVPYLVMQLVKGHSLEKYLKQPEPLPPREIARLGQQVALGLAAAHAQGLVHRDIKPANILIEEGSNQVKITDFGLARAVDDVSLTQSGVIAGTPAYMSPEQARGDAIDHRTDLFSLGSVLYALCTGRAPFRGGSVMELLRQVCDETPVPVRKLNPAVPEWLASIIERLLAKAPAQRFPSAQAVADELEQHLVEPIAPPRRQRRGLLLAAGVCALMAALALYFTWPGGDSLDPTNPAVPGGHTDGWVPLFNGRDLTGWREHPRQPGDWIVRDGVLVNNGPTSHLYTVANHFENFHLRVEAKVSAGSEGGIVFRSAFGPGEARHDLIPDGYEAKWCNDGPDHWPRTGSLSGLHTVAATPARPDEWFTQEIIANGNRLLVKVNGEITTDVVDEKRTHLKGCLALQKFGPGVVQFRRIEVKELPPSPVAELPPGRPDPEKQPPVVWVADSSDWVQLFNGKDQTGWKTHPKQPGEWAVEKDETGRELLVGRQGPGYLFTERGDFENFHLRAEVKINDRGNSGLFFRTPFTSDDWSGKFPPGYEVQINSNGDPYRTGSLLRLDSKVLVLSHSRVSPVAANQWCLLEVLAEGPRTRIRIDGKELADCVDAEYQRGHLALQVIDGASVVHFKKIEIKELSQVRVAQPLVVPTPPQVKVETRDTLTGNAGKIYSLALSADGKTLAVGQKDGVVQVWTAGPAGWELNSTLRGHEKTVGQLVFSSDGSWLASSSADTTARLWKRGLDRWEEAQVLKGHTSTVYALAFSPDDQKLYTGGGVFTAVSKQPRDGEVKLWDCATGKEEPLPAVKHPACVLSLRMMPDRRSLAIGYQHQLLRLWNPASGEVIQELPESCCLYTLVLGPDGKTLITGGCQSRVHVWSGSIGAWSRSPTTYSQPYGTVRGAAVDRESKVLMAFASGQGTVGFTELGSGDVLTRVKADAPDRVVAAVFAPEHSRLVTARLQGKMEIAEYRYQPGSGKPEFVVLARAGKPARWSYTLSGAVNLAESGDTIEVRTNGPHITDAIVVGKKDLVIRAGAGFTPVIRLDPPGPQNKFRALLSTDGSLVLEGLELQRSTPTLPGDESLILARGERFQVANCRLSTRGASFNLRGTYNKDFEVRNCLALSAPSWYAISELYPPAGSRIRVENCALGGAGFWFMLSPSYLKGGHVDVALTRNTFTVDSIAEARFLGETPGPVPGTQRTPVLWEVNDNLLDFTTNYLQTRRLIAAPAPGSSEPLLLQWLTLKERNNVYSQAANFLTHLRGLVPSTNLGGERKTLVEWRNLWRLSGNDYLEGKVRYLGADLHQRIRTQPETITPEDFRLHPDSVGWRTGMHRRDLGADLDLVGPGAAYERWKQTPEYQEWLKRTKQM